MTKVYIIHGWSGSPKESVIQWLKLETEKQGNVVYAPAMPNADEPEINAWVGKLKELIKPDIKTILVGHSIGCQAVLRYIETLPADTSIAGVVLIAPWMELDKNTIEEEGQEIVNIAKPWMETPIDFKKVKQHVNKFVCIFSDNDPYVPLSQKDLFERELGAEIIVENNKGHFTESDGVKDLHSALNAILEMNS